MEIIPLAGGGYIYNKVEICGVNTSKLKVLSDAEKEDLLRRAKAGDDEARNDLINGNLRLVLSVIQKFSAKNDNPDDLFQVGCVGLIKAVDNFDIGLNVKFSTYAVPMIIGEVRRYLRDNNIIRVSRSVRDLAYKALAERERLSLSLGREPTTEEICKSMNAKKKEIFEKNPDSTLTEISLRDLEAALDAVIDPVSLYDPVYSEGGDSIFLMDQICDNKGSDENWTENIALGEAMKKLEKREKRILQLRFYQGKTQMEVAQEVGISQAQVSRLEKGAIERIRRQM